ncbi:MAG: transglycosylase SLT domain-containing protein [Rhodocyclales bacterium]|nr:transglycosylase SLT domain-containing protein [Rhodocyclales bacterium]
MKKHATALSGILLCLALSAAFAASPDEVVPVAAEGQPESPVPALEIREELPSIATIDLTVSPDDLWERMRLGFGMPNLDSPLVHQQQAWYLARPEYLKRVVERSRRYMHHIVEELERRGMPTELALLPIVESAYNPMAYSRAHASGMWQFIPSTGKTYRLDQNWWIDERRDIVASTSAALEYLQSIYEMHGDWHLALASYNWGENAVARAIAKNQAKGLPTDYLSLTMPAETRNYVPKLQALKNIVAQPQLYNVKLDPIANKPYFVTVDKPADMDVALAARLAEISAEEFLALNPAYNRPVMPAKGNTSMVLPAEQVEVFQANLENHDKPLVSWRAYTLKKGEKLESVAARHSLTAARLRQVNGISGKMKIRPGHTLLVPAKGADVSSANLQAVNLPLVKPSVKTAVRGGNKASPRGGKKHVAKKGARQPARKAAAKRPRPRS